ncbi:MAG: hypothetical protein H7269_08150 [Cellulomonas sp.]|nr:hypothetical protein [Cellulomonas sp.]
MSTDQGRPEQPEPDQSDNVQDTIPLDLDQAPLDSQPTLELTGLGTPEAYRTADPTTEFVLPAPAPSTPAQSAPAQPEALPPAPPQPARPGPRVGTVVWGLILAVIGVGVIAAAAGARFDVELVAIALLVLAGVGLVVGSVATSVRRRRS